MVAGVPDDQPEINLAVCHRPTGDVEVDAIRAVTAIIDQFEPAVRRRIATYLAERYEVRR